MSLKPSNIRWIKTILICNELSSIVSYYSQFSTKLNKNINVNTSLLSWDRKTGFNLIIFISMSAEICLYQMHSITIQNFRFSLPNQSII